MSHLAETVQAIPEHPVVTVLALAAGALGAGGAVATSAEASLNGFGPALSHNINDANRQLDYRLRAEGPDGCAARSIAEIAGIKTHEGRAKYVTAGNVDLSKMVTVTNHQYPINTGATGNCEPVRIPNDHSSSVAAKVEMGRVPQKTVVRAHKNAEGGWDLTGGVVRADCGMNALLRQVPHAKRPTRKPHNEDVIKVDISAGVKLGVETEALAQSSSTSSAEVTVICPDGSKLTSSSYANAEANALASAAAKIGVSERIKLIGDHVSFEEYKLRIDEKVKAYVEAAAKTAATTHVVTTAECAPGVTPPPVINNPPQVRIENLQHLGVNKEAEICEVETPPVGSTIATRSFKVEQGGVNIVSAVHPGPSPNEFCVTLHGTSTASTGNVVSATVAAANGTSATDFSNPFEVFDIPK